MDKKQKKAVLKAYDDLKKLAARALASRDEALEKAQGLERRMAETESILERAVGADDDALAMKVLGQKGTIDIQLRAARDEAQAADLQYQEAVKELKELKRAIEELDRAEATYVARAATVSADPLGIDLSPEDQALQGVRDNIREMEATIRLNDELGGKRRQEIDTRALDAKAAQDRARRELDELKAKLKGGAASGKSGPKKSL